MGMLAVSTQSYFKSYLLFSLLSSSLLYLGFLITFQNTFLNHTFYLSCLTALNYFYFHTNSSQFKFSAQNRYSYFSLQALFSFLISFEINSIIPFYFCLIPCFSIFFSNVKKRQHKKAGLLIGVLLVISSFVFNLTKTSSLIPNETPYSLLNSFFFFSFIVWGLGPIYISSLFDNSSSVKDSFSGGLFNDSHFKDISSEQKYFFHDLTNHVHGMSLFLEHRTKHHKALSIDETISLKKEVDVMKILLKDHYNLYHKNLEDINDTLPFNHLRESLISLVENYLPIQTVDINFEFKGLLEKSENSEIINSTLVHNSSFFRIMTNLVKNVAESSSKKVDFIFYYDKFGLNIMVKNKIFNLHKIDEDDLIDSLKNKIAGINDEKISHHGVGLESVSFLCEKIGGKYNFYLENNHWITEVFLPKIHASSLDSKNLNGFSSNKDFNFKKSA